MNPHTHSFAMVEVVNKTITSQFLKTTKSNKNECHTKTSTNQLIVDSKLKAISLLHQVNG
jgi:hypothetical protein